MSRDLTSNYRQVVRSDYNDQDRSVGPIRRKVKKRPDPTKSGKVCKKLSRREKRALAERNAASQPTRPPTPSFSPRRATTPVPEELETVII